MWGLGTLTFFRRKERQLLPPFPPFGLRRFHRSGAPFRGPGEPVLDYFGLLQHLLLKFSTTGLLTGPAWCQVTLAVRELLVRPAFCSQTNMSGDHRTACLVRSMVSPAETSGLRASLPASAATERFSKSSHGRQETAFSQ